MKSPQWQNTIRRKCCWRHSAKWSQSSKKKFTGKSRKKRHDAAFFLIWLMVSLMQIFFKTLGNISHRIFCMWRIFCVTFFLSIRSGCFIAFFLHILWCVSRCFLFIYFFFSFINFVFVFILMGSAVGLLGFWSSVWHKIVYCQWMIKILLLFWCKSFFCGWNGKWLRKKQHSLLLFYSSGILLSIMQLIRNLTIQKTATEDEMRLMSIHWCVAWCPPPICNQLL